MPSAQSTAAPTVTVLMAVYNGQQYLRRAVDSVLAQTFTDFDFVVIDDGSTDGSAEILRAYAAADPRVRLISRPNRGLTPSLNEGLRAAAGRYVARMDSDDVCLPERFAAQVAFLDAHPDVTLVGTEVELIDPAGLPIRTMPQLWGDHASIDRALLTKGWPLVHPAVMFRRDAVMALGGYDERYRTNQDHDLFLRIAEHGQLANIPRVLLKYRQHFTSVSLAKSKQQAEVVRDILREAYRRRGLTMPAAMETLSPRVLDQRGYYTAWFHEALDAGHLRTARHHAYQVFKRAPLSKDTYRLLFRAARRHLNPSAYHRPA